ncbi:hypothetical protein ASE30_24255 [Achromobacter sp. Root83]|uniref:CrpP-related protein n=1 Tax=Achromobacter sp. Root83 TaxID=1736602 RepID=UPI00070D218D|nr:CrpP-related protein [Achromobacter sp. Root83]KRC80549.1 hypothetical protein ASE30_24255 [Achromobacter sp. Root83]
MLAAIQEEGAAAASQGLSILDCPYLRRNGLSSYTGAITRDWSLWVQSWEDGWKNEQRRQIERRVSELEGYARKQAERVRQLDDRLRELSEQKARLRIHGLQSEADFQHNADLDVQINAVSDMHFAAYNKLQHYGQRMYQAMEMAADLKRKILNISINNV